MRKAIDNLPCRAEAYDVPPQVIEERKMLVALFFRHMIIAGRNDMSYTPESRLRSPPRVESETPRVLNVGIDKTSTALGV